MPRSSLAVMTSPENQPLPPFENRAERRLRGRITRRSGRRPLVDSPAEIAAMTEGTC